MSIIVVLCHMTDLEAQVLYIFRGPTSQRRAKFRQILNHGSLPTKLNNLEERPVEECQKEDTNKLQQQSRQLPSRSTDSGIEDSSMAAAYPTSPTQVCLHHP